MTTTLIKPLSTGFQILQPKANHHLQVTCKVIVGSHFYHEHFYFPEGSYNGEIVSDYLKEFFYWKEENSRQNVYYTFIDHKYLPVWNGELPELKGENDSYYIFAITAHSPLHYENQLGGIWLDNPKEVSVQAIKGYVKDCIGTDHIIAIQVLDKWSDVPRTSEFSMSGDF